MAKSINKMNFDELKALALKNAELGGRLKIGMVVKRPYWDDGFFLYIGKGYSPCSGSINEGVTVDEGGVYREYVSTMFTTPATVKEVRGFFKKLEADKQAFMDQVRRVYVNLNN